jgi:hypothetical protein
VDETALQSVLGVAASDDRESRFDRRDAMAGEPDPEAQSEAEIEEEAAHEEEDRITQREALEEELMEEHRSQEGRNIP